jgi:serine protease
VGTLRLYLVGVLATFSIASTNAPAATSETNPVRTQPATASQGSTQRLLVKLRSTAASARSRAQPATNAIQALTIRVNLTLVESRQIAAGLHAMHVVPVPGETIASTLARLRADADVEYAVPDQRRYPHALPNDPLYVSQWYEQNAQPAAIDATTAWDTTTGRSDIVIADLDTGIRFDHPDLGVVPGNRLLPGYNFISDPLIANDGGGRDADASDPGDWVTAADTANPTFAGCTVANSSWHGTRTAGILGAITNNSTGIAGITWQTMILPVRVLGKCGGQDSDILDAMRWAAGLQVVGIPNNPHPAQIINMSLGAVGACTAAQQTVIDEVVARGVLVVVSAGNDSGPVASPANCNGVAAVGGLGHTGTKVYFSNLGAEVALSAPAGDCVNTTGACLFSIDTTVNNGTTTPGTNGYTDQLNPNLGTSFSAPMVSAIAALMTSVNSNLRAPQLIARLKEGAKAFPVSSDPTVPNCHVPVSSSDLQAECNCTTRTCGAGMGNAPGAVTAALRPIAAVMVPAAVAAGQNVTLSGTGSAAACAHTITTYAWTNVSNPTNAIQGANTATATVVAPTSGSYTVRLTVTDDAGRQDAADVVVSSTAATTTAPASANNGTCAVGPPANIAVSVSPATASVRAGIGTQAFTATVTNTSNTAVTWQVNGVAGGNSTVGMISTSGAYSAPSMVPSPATVIVTAVSVADPTRSGSAQVTITAPGPAPVSVSVTPGTASIQTGGTQSFTATVTNTSNTAVTWQVNGVAGGNSTMGVISTSGVYSAPSMVPSPATVTVTAVSVADPTRSGSAHVTVTAPAPGPAPVSVSVIPGTASVQTGGTQSFTATVTNTSNTAVTWQVNGVAGGNSTMGMISTSGVYSAPSMVPSPTTVTVTAVSVADPTRSGSAHVTVTPASSAPTSGGPNPGGSGGGGGGGSMDALTLLACALAVAFGCRRRGMRRCL